MVEREVESAAARAKAPSEMMVKVPPADMSVTDAGSKVESMVAPGARLAKAEAVRSVIAGRMRRPLKGSAVPGLS